MVGIRRRLSFIPRRTTTTTTNIGQSKKLPDSPEQRFVHFCCGFTEEAAQDPRINEEEVYLPSWQREVRPVAERPPMPKPASPGCFLIFYLAACCLPVSIDSISRKFESYFLSRIF